MILINGDQCTVGSFVIVRNHNRMGETFVAHVDEILQRCGSTADLAHQPDGVLLHHARVGRTTSVYCMPVIELLYSWIFVSLQVSDVFDVLEIYEYLFIRICFVRSMFSTIVQLAHVVLQDNDTFTRNVSGPNTLDQLWFTLAALMI